MRGFHLKNGKTTAEVRDHLMDCLTAILGTEGVTQNFPGDVMQVLPNTLSVRFQGNVK